jgi:hypothetical protein
MLLALLASTLAAPAFASFHFMQIEQVIGGVNGNTDMQAVQLRMRAGGQNLVNTTRLIVRDAAGNNPITLVVMGSNVSGNAAGDRILIVSPEFLSNFTPTPDFVMSALIPPAYLAAGKLSFEDSGGTVYWSLAWGGASYTGGNTGNTANDADGNFSPPFGGALPSGGGQSLLFPGAAADLSTNNAADYMTSLGDAVFTNNAGVSGGAVPVELMQFSVD